MKHIVEAIFYLVFSSIIALTMDMLFFWQQ